MIRITKSMNQYGTDYIRLYLDEEVLGLFPTLYVDVREIEEEIILSQPTLQSRHSYKIAPQGLNKALTLRILSKNAAQWVGEWEYEIEDDSRVVISRKVYDEG